MDDDVVDLVDAALRRRHPLSGRCGRLGTHATVEELGLSGVIMESNVGGRIPLERVLTSIRLYAQEVAPRLR